MGSSPAGGIKEVACQEFWVAAEDQSLAAEASSMDVECHLSEEKGLELVYGVRKFQLDIGLTSTHSKGSGSNLLQRGWTLFHFGVANSEKQWAGVAILVAPWISACTFTPVNEKVTSLRL